MTQPVSPLVSASALRQRLDGGDALTLLDVRWALGAPSQRSQYEAGHLPGARWVEFEEALSGTPGRGGRHPLPDTTVFQHAMRAAGVRNDVPVVVYDGGNALAAARCWWLLRHHGKDDVQVLDGGLPAWQTAGGTITTEPVPAGDGDFLATGPTLPVLDADEAADFAVHHVLVDARPADRFAGQNETVDPVAGHIPGAISLPALSNLTSDGTFLPGDDLTLRFSSRGLSGHERVGVYCGSGVQAMHLALALEASDLQTETHVYVGSWSHYITDPDRPVELGGGTSPRA